jgi:hypothetical protein
LRDADFPKIGSIGMFGHGAVNVRYAGRLKTAICSQGIETGDHSRFWAGAERTDGNPH